MQNGIQFIMQRLDFEETMNMSRIIRVAGILGMHFDQCQWERNDSVQLVKVQIDSTGNTQGYQVKSFNDC
ncbi:hypothetical protein OGY35_22250 [Citrobacter sp. Ct235]|uniref:hypothetical protein n=1 Tax=Citrobacter sp. Ct235 TaxID=2985157 RepID=UPI002577DA16|nr:hypothetical protein [Citrobacter sp. Ct235]MDM2738084.1 hypothetical protein [Citrobacter sp. Ct235]